MKADLQMIVEWLEVGRSPEEITAATDLLGRKMQQQTPKANLFTKALQRMGLVAAPTTKQLHAAGIAVNQFGAQASRGQTKIKRFGSVGLQQVGYQVGDFAVQVQGGTNALVALGQQGSQLLGILGPMGAIAGAALAIWTAIARVKQETSSTGLVMEKVWADVKKAIEPIKPVLDGIMGALSAVGDAFIGFANLVLNNTERAIAYLGGLIAAIGIKMVAAWIASGRAALAFFRLIRLGLLSTGIGIFAVAIGEIAYQFAKGGDAIAATSAWIGKLFSALGDIAKAVGTRIKLGIMAWVDTARADLYAFEAFWYEQFINIVTWLETSWVGTVIRVAKGAVAGIKQTFLEVASAITDPFVKGINDAIAKLNEFGDTKAIKFLSKISVDDSIFKILDEGITPIETSGDDGFDRAQSIVDAIKAAYKEDLSVPILGNIDKMRGAMETARTMEDAIRTAIGTADIELENITASQKKALDELFALFKGGASDIQIEDWFGVIQDEADDSGGAVDKLKEKLTELQERNQSVVDAIGKGFSGFFNSIVDGTKSMKDAFKDMARSILASLWDILVVQQLVGNWDAKTGVGSGLSGIIGGFVSGLSGASPTSSPRPAPRPFADGGIINTPTLFPMANGMGLMGEAGPEAVMPLTRGKDGKLGVQSQGGGDTVVVNQYFNFSANGDESVKRIIAQAAPQISKMTQKDILKSRRSGGQMKAAFG